MYEIEESLLEVLLKMIEMVGEEKYASLLCSFGSRLLDAPFHELSVTKLAQVLESCSTLSIRSLLIDDR